jgi:hypothetical protein
MLGCGTRHPENQEHQAPHAHTEDRSRRRTEVREELESEVRNRSGPEQQPELSTLCQCDLQGLERLSPNPNDDSAVCQQ